MPIICMFDGIKIYIYVEIDAPHKKPHIHAYYGEYGAVLDFDGYLLEGELPRKKLAMVTAWVLMHQEELQADYELLQEGQTPFRIDPLR